MIRRHSALIIIALSLFSVFAMASEPYMVHSKFTDGTRDTYIASLILMQKPESYTDLHNMPGRKEMRFTFIAPSYSTRSFIRHIGSWTIIGNKEGAFGKDVKDSSTKALLSLKDKIYAQIKRRQLKNGDYFSVVSESKKFTKFYVNDKYMMQVNDPALFSYMLNMWVSSSSAIKDMRSELLQPKMSSSTYKSIASQYKAIHSPSKAQKAAKVNPNDKAAVAAQKRQALVARKKDYESQLIIEAEERKRLEKEQLIKEKMAAETEALRLEREKLKQERLALEKLKADKELRDNNQIEKEKQLAQQKDNEEKARLAEKQKAEETRKKEARIATQQKAATAAPKVSSQVTLPSPAAPAAAVSTPTIVTTPSNKISAVVKTQPAKKITSIDASLPEGFKPIIKSKEDVIQLSSDAFNIAISKIDKNLTSTEVVLYCTEQGKIISAETTNNKLSKSQKKQLIHAAKSISPIAISVDMTAAGIYAISLK